MKNDITVFLSPAAHDLMLMSAIEVFPRETEGVLAGRKLEGGDYTIDRAYPFQTSKRGFEWVQEGNARATRRVHTLLHAFNGSPEHPCILGGYHSHPLTKHSQLNVCPSRKDLEVIRDDLPNHGNLDAWLELIVRVDIPFLERRGNKGVVHYRRLKKVGTTARYTPYNAYGFLIGAFLVHPDAKRGYDELRVELHPQKTSEHI